MKVFARRPTAKLAALGSSSMMPLTDKDRGDLTKQLMVRLRRDAKSAQRIHFPARASRVMLADLGAVETCNRLITSPNIPEGFSVLFEKNRLDLTAEAAVLNGPWKALFDPLVLARAEKRLRAFGRSDLIP
jgi:hypothetical protein